MIIEEFWLILCASLCNVTCAILGCFLVLRRMSMIGDAITHAVLPGLALAFLITNTLDTGPMFIGALAFGVLTTVLTQLLGQSRFIQADAALGIVFTMLFALGIFLIDIVTRDGSVHIDVNCVLEGELVYIIFDTVTIAGVTMPSVLPWIVLILAITVAFVVVFFKELKLVSFDPEYAKVQGFSSNLIHYTLMLLVAAVAVTAFRLVGSVLVVAMLILPAATAQLISTRLVTMLILASICGVISCITGYYSAVAVDTYVPGMIAVCSGLLYALVVTFAPGSGLLARLYHRIAFQFQIMEDDILLACYRIQERAETRHIPITEQQIQKVLELPTRPHAWMYTRALRALTRQQHLKRLSRNTVSLTDRGQTRGQQLIRSHRLWESYLEEEFALPPDHLHHVAERLEHYIDAPLQSGLAGAVKSNEVDPQGKVIPPGTGS